MDSSDKNGLSSTFPPAPNPPRPFSPSSPEEHQQIPLPIPNPPQTTPPPPRSIQRTHSSAGSPQRSDFGETTNSGATDPGGKTPPLCPEPESPAKSQMGSGGGRAEIDVLERPLLGGSSATAGEERVLYSAAFEEEEAFVRYETAQWVVYSLLLLLAWGVGLLMLLYVPVRRYVARRDFRSRRLYVTPDAIVYKVTRPVAIPWLGILKKEKYILLPSVADIAVEQGYLQSKFGIYSVRIENVGVKRPSNDDVHIQGISNPRAFKKAVLTRLYSLKGRSLSQAISTLGDMSPFPRNMGTDSLQSGDAILQKLEEVEGSVKRVQNLLEKIPPQSSYFVEE